MTIVASVAAVEGDHAASTEPAIVIAASGMATGGRVLHHLAAALPDPHKRCCSSAIRRPARAGALLVDGAKQIKMLGHDVPVAARIERLDSMSAHADAAKSCAGCRASRSRRR